MKMNLNHITDLCLQADVSKSRLQESQDYLLLADWEYFSDPPLSQNGRQAR